MNVCGGTLMERNMFMEYFFQVIYKIHSILKSKKQTLSNSDEQKAHIHKMKFPWFFTRSREMTCFSIVQHNFPFL